MNLIMIRRMRLTCNESFDAQFIAKSLYSTLPFEVVAGDEGTILLDEVLVGCTELPVIRSPLLTVVDLLGEVLKDVGYLNGGQLG